MFFQLHHAKLRPSFSKALWTCNGKRAMQSFLLSFFSMALLFGVPKPAFAWFKICNHSSDDYLTVAYGYREHGSSNSHGLMVITPAGWVSKGWWNIAQGACKIVYGGDITNRYSYFHVSGRKYDEINVSSFCVMTDAAFLITQYDDGGFRDNTLQSSDTCPGKYKTFYRVDTGGYADNYTLNLL